MDLTFWQSLFTVLLFVIFLGIVGWAYSKSPKNRFEEASNLPFEDDEVHDKSIDAKEKHQ